MGERGVFGGFAGSADPVCRAAPFGAVLLGLWTANDVRENGSYPTEVITAGLALIGLAWDFKAHLDGAMLTALIDATAALLILEGLLIALTPAGVILAEERGALHAKGDRLHALRRLRRSDFLGYEAPLRPLRPFGVPASLSSSSNLSGAQCSKSLRHGREVVGITMRRQAVLNDPTVVIFASSNRSAG